MTCISERSSSSVFTLKNFIAAGGNGSHDLLITGRTLSFKIYISAYSSLNVVHRTPSMMLTNLLRDTSKDTSKEKALDDLIVDKCKINKKMFDARHFFDSSAALN